MRARFWVAMVAISELSGLGLGGCGDNHATAADMAMPALNCLGYGGCVLVCYEKAGATGDATDCIDSCKAITRPLSVSYWSEAYLCGQDYCLGVGDAGVGKCVVDGTQDVDAPGAPAGSCVACLLESSDIVLGDFSNPNAPAPPTGICPDPTSPDCKGGPACMAKFQNCIDDL